MITEGELQNNSVSTTAKKRETKNIWSEYLRRYSKQGESIRIDNSLSLSTKEPHFFFIFEFGVTDDNQNIVRYAYKEETLADEENIIVTRVKITENSKSVSPKFKDMEMIWLTCDQKLYCIPNWTYGYPHIEIYYVTYDTKTPKTANEITIKLADIWEFGSSITKFIYTAPNENIEDGQTYQNLEKRIVKETMPVKEIQILSIIRDTVTNYTWIWIEELCLNIGKLGYEEVIEEDIYIESDLETQVILYAKDSYGTIIKKFLIFSYLPYHIRAKRNLNEIVWLYNIKYRTVYNEKNVEDYSDYLKTLSIEGPNFYHIRKEMQKQNKELIDIFTNPRDVWQSDQGYYLTPKDYAFEVRHTTNYVTVNKHVYIKQCLVFCPLYPNGLEL